MYYNKQGEKIELMEWAKLMENNEYKRIAEDTRGIYWISTVWLGLNYSFNGGLEIFETMVFEVDKKGKKNVSGLDCYRYSTLEEAEKGHKKMVEKLKLIAEKKQNKMNKLLTKLDDLQFIAVKNFILKRVKESKGKKHKYHILLNIKKYDIAIFVIVAFVIAPISIFMQSQDSSMYEKILSISFNILIWTLYLALNMSDFFRTKKYILFYDRYYEQRKNPIVYESLKNAYKELYKEGRNGRKKMTIATIGVLCVLIFIGLFFGLLFGFHLDDMVILYLIGTFLFTGTIDKYVLYVFDFDSPEKKRKKSPVKVLTKIMKQAFDNAVSDIKPQALPSPI